MGNNKKRTKDEASPGAVSDQPEKIHVQGSAPKPPGHNPSQLQHATVNRGFQSPPTGYAMPPPLMGQYLAPHLQFLSQQSASPLLANSAPPVMSTSPNNIDNGTQMILNKLLEMENRQKTMESKLSKLDQIDNKISSIETRVIFLETKLIETDKRLIDIEASRAFDSQTCDELKAKLNSVEALLTDQKAENKRLSSGLESVRLSNNDLKEEIIDLQARSMRDNLLFYNFNEELSFEARKKENCLLKIQDFCESVLKIENFRDSCKIDRAHRIGSFDSKKKRPIVVKFNYYGDKLCVKEAARNLLLGTNYSVDDQLPKEIQERRRKLVPFLVQARDQNKDASLVYDTLYIDRVRYTYDKPPPGPVPELPPRRPRIRPQPWRSGEASYESVSRAPDQRLHGPLPPEATTNLEETPPPGPQTADALHA